MMNSTGSILVLVVMVLTLFVSLSVLLRSLALIITSSISLLSFRRGSILFLVMLLVLVMMLLWTLSMRIQRTIFGGTNRLRRLGRLWWKRDWWRASEAKDVV